MILHDLAIMALCVFATLISGHATSDESKENEHEN
jgi:hypothetical protein